MARVTVFVDEAVQGELPRLCAKDGVPTGDRLRFEHLVGETDRLGILWLLVFAGPPGWLVLLLLAGRDDGGERLLVDLPFSEAAHDRLVAARRQRLRGQAVAVAGLVVGAAVLAVPALDRPVLGPAALVVAAAAVVGGVVATLLGERRAGRATVAVELDASRRWVTLERVHPAFAEACEGHAVDRGHPTWR